MSTGIRRRLAGAVALGLAASAVVAQGVPAKVIPYVSQGEGLTAAQLAEVSGTAGPSRVIPYLSQGHGITADHMAELGGTATRTSVIPYLSQGRGITAAQLVELGGTATAGGEQGASRPDDRANHGPLPTRNEPHASAVRASDGFDWSDAGVGAGGALGLVALAGALAVMVRRSRHGQLAGA